MSLHAELGPEAQARLDSQRRNSTISSVIISILAVVLIGLILAFILINPLFQETPTIVTYQGNSNKDEEMETRKMTNQIQRKPSAPSSSLAKVLAAQNEDGSFKPTGWTKHGTNKTHYRTCLAALMLEVYYRFLPGTGAGVKR